MARTAAADGCNGCAAFVVQRAQPLGTACRMPVLTNGCFRRFMLNELHNIGPRYCCASLKLAGENQFQSTAVEKALANARCLQVLSSVRACAFGWIQSLAASDRPWHRFLFRLQKAAKCCKQQAKRGRSARRPCAGRWTESSMLLPILWQET